MATLIINFTDGTQKILKYESKQKANNFMDKARYHGDVESMSLIEGDALLRKYTKCT